MLQDLNQYERMSMKELKMQYVLGTLPPLGIVEYIARKQARKAGIKSLIIMLLIMLLLLIIKYY